MTLEDHEPVQHDERVQRIREDVDSGFRMDYCECGHAELDHRSNAVPWPQRLRYGACLVTDCSCREYRDA